LDLGLTRAYAERAAGTWADRFILSGSTVLGDLLAPTERALILDVWSEVLERSRLVACCWCREDIGQAGQRKILPLVVMQHLHDRAQACSFFAGLPEEAFVYSNPKFTATPLDPALAIDAEQRGLLPAGAKISKLAVGDIGRIRSSIGNGFTLWDGSSRHIEASIAAGASGVVATPLAVLPEPFPSRSTEKVQAAVKRLYTQVDRAASREDRMNLLTSLFRHAT